MPLFDPSTYYDQQLRRMSGGAGQQPPAFPPLSPDDTESALGSLGRKVLGGVGYVGGLLDKTLGGRAVRGLLGGKPNELLSLIPGSDTFGLTSEDDIVHGRDLLEKAGLVSHGVPGSGLDFGDVAGFGLDVVLDPSVYLGNWVGKLGQATGATAALGKGAMKLPGVARAYEALRPVGRGLTAMFDPAVHDTIGTASQRAMREMSGALPAAKYGATKSALDVFEGLRGPGGEVAPATISQFANVLEGNPPAPPWVVGPPTPSPVPVQGPAAGARSLLNAANAAERQVGMMAPYLENYLPVGKLAVEPGAAGGTGRGAVALDPFSRHMIHRDVELLGDLPRQGWVNPLTSQTEAAVPGYRQMTPLQRQAAVRGNVLEPWEDAKAAMGMGQNQQLFSQPERAQLDALRAKSAAGQQLTPAEEELRATLQGAEGRLIKQSERMADWLISPEMLGYAEHGLPLYGTSPLENITKRLTAGVTGVEKTKALYGLLQSAATPAGNDTVPLVNVLSKMGHLDQNAAQNVLAGQMGKSLQDLQALHVPREIAEDVGRAIKGFTLPTAMEPVANAVDSFTSLFRGLNASLIPTRVARFTRNLGQQVWGMFVGGHYDPTAGPGMGLLKPMSEASALLRAGPGFVLPDANTIPGLTHLTPELATRELQKEMFAAGAAGPGRTTGKVESYAPGALHAAQAQYHLPGSEQPGLGEVLKSAVPGSWQEANPLNIGGFGGRQASTFAPSVAGREMDSLIDDATRGGSWLALRRQGMSPLEAAKEVERVHYNYGNLTGFEKNVARRVLPFYSWTRQNIPAQVRQLWEQPGGKTAQAIRATGDLRQKEGFIPPDIAEGVGLPVGAEQEGTQRYLTSLGLPFEDFGDVVTGRGALGNTGRTLANFMSQANPLIKAPIEVATGEQLMSGRNLSDLYGPTGNVLVDQAIMNAPGSSIYTGLRTLFDPRKSAEVKAANLLTPAKFTDVDMEKRRDIAARELVTDLLRQYPGVRTFQEPYVPAAQAGTLDPEAGELFRLYKSLEQRGQQKAREAKKVGVKQ